MQSRSRIGILFQLQEGWNAIQSQDSWWSCVRKIRLRSNLQILQSRLSSSDDCFAASVWISILDHLLQLHPICHQARVFANARNCNCNPTNFGLARSLVPNSNCIWTKRHDFESYGQYVYVLSSCDSCYCLKCVDISWNQGTFRSGKYRKQHQSCCKRQRGWPLPLWEALPKTKSHQRFWNRISHGSYHRSPNAHACKRTGFRFWYATN